MLSLYADNRTIPSLLCAINYNSLWTIKPLSTTIVLFFGAPLSTSTIGLSIQ